MQRRIPVLCAGNGCNYPATFFVVEPNGASYLEVMGRHHGGEKHITRIPWPYVLASDAVGVLDIGKPDKQK